MLENTFLRRLSVFAMCLALAGCCANDVCNCQDELADALFFRFNYTRKRKLDVSNKTIGFNASDIDTIRISRTNVLPAALQGPGKDTLGFVRQTDVVTVVRQLDTSKFPGDTIIMTEVPYTYTNGTTTILKEQDILVINNASPFASSSTTKLNAYTYRIQPIKNRQPLATYYITGIDLKGRYNANGCCTCYENTGKTYTLTTGVTPTSAAKVEQINAAAPDSVNSRRVVRLSYPH